MFRKEILIVLIILALFGMACGLTADISGKDAVTKPAESEGQAPNAQAGKELFSQQDCAACHVTGAGIVAPSLEGLFGETVTLESGESVTVDEDYLRESILSPQEKIVAGYQPIMPAFDGELTEEELAALVDYIKSLSE